MRLYISKLVARCVVLDAGKTTVSGILPFLRSRRIHWFAFVLKDRYFVFRRSEIYKRLLNALASRSVGKVLLLEKAAPSHAVRAGAKWLDVQKPPLRGGPEKRAVFIAKKRGENFVAAVGILQKSRPKKQEQALFARNAASGRQSRGQTEKTFRGRPASFLPARPHAVRLFFGSAPRARVAGPFKRQLAWSMDRLRASFSAPGKPWVTKPYEIVDVFYATDRKFEVCEGVGKKLEYLNRLDENAAKLSYGVCKVSIPSNHVMGKLETPSILHFEIHENPEKHFVLLDCSAMSSRSFFDQVRSIVVQGDNKSAFVFIHGYNVSFDDAVKRTAQLARDMRFQGVPILYSWASAANKSRYPKDEETVELTKKRLKEFLQSLSQKSGAKETHLIAHSMGNRALMGALSLLPSAPAASPKLFKQVVLTAPDIPRQDIETLVAAAGANAERVTLYASKKDKALLLSRKFHSYQRLGYVYKFPFYIFGMDSIDASKVKTDFTGHSAFARTRTILGDLSALVRYGEMPSNRFGLKELPTPNGLCWTFF